MKQISVTVSCKDGRDLAQKLEETAILLREDAEEFNDMHIDDSMQYFAGIVDITVIDIT